MTKTRPARRVSFLSIALTSTALAAPAPPSIFVVAPSGVPAAGPTFGCGDRLVEVALTTGSVTPMKTALTTLFTYRPRDPGLINPLRRGRLRVERITLDARRRTAVVHLSGTLQLNGVCDAPRVTTQLNETATQFPNVRQACFFLNGAPLERALDESGRTIPADVCTRTFTRRP
ncbi:GerMN domain-containing protein [Deinococcus pimensis]|uniref:GerMN domain-containing protein n=1 Tax=Deinococcus pimensis TaxID=309888 RepID=UPI0004824455|nr:GerMN domain-containing protein [Deinococcus pimensis]